MPAEESAPNPQAGAGDETPQAGNTNNPPAGGEQDSAPRTFDAEYVARLRSEAASYRTKLANAEKELQTRKDAELSGTEKLQKERDELIQERDTLAREVRDSKLIVAASKAQAKYPDLIIAKVPHDAELDDKTLERVFKDLRASYPDAFRTGTADGGAGGGSTPNGQDMNTLIRSMAGRR